MEMEVVCEKLGGEEKTTRKGIITTIRGEDFKVRVGSELRGTVPWVELAALTPLKTAPQA
jgi:hypothetical protein